MGVVFDKLEFLRRLEGGGEFTRAQAERLTDAFYEAVSESVATKPDVSAAVHGLKADVQDLRHELKSEFKEIRHEIALFRSELKQECSAVRAAISESRVWAIGVAAISVGFLASIKFFG